MEPSYIAHMITHMYLYIAPSNTLMTDHNTHLASLGEFTMVSQPIRLILVDWFVLNLKKNIVEVVFSFFWGRLPYFFWGRLPFVFLRSSWFFNIFLRFSFFLQFLFRCRLSIWVKIMLHTQNELPMLSGSALQV